MVSTRQAIRGSERLAGPARQRKACCTRDSGQPLTIPAPDRGQLRLARIMTDQQDRLGGLTGTEDNDVGPDGGLYLLTDEDNGRILKLVPR